LVDQGANHVIGGEGVRNINKSSHTVDILSIDKHQFKNSQLSPLVVSLTLTTALWLQSCINTI